MVETELTINERSPPDTVAKEATAIAKRNVAGRVKVEPDGSGGWRVIADGAGGGSTGPPMDINPSEWDGGKPLTQREFEEFKQEVSDRTPSRKQITENYGRANAKSYWRITMNYDDERFND